MDRMRRVYQGSLLLPAVLALGMFLAACGSEKPTGVTVDTVAAPVSSGTAVGMKNCTSCHADATAEWKLGKHANMDDGDLDGVGSPSLAFIDSQTNPSVCKACHDALGDGQNQLVENYTGNVPRPVVGCESCHGGGSEHNGIAPMPFTGLGSTGSGTALQSSEFNTCTSSCHLTAGNDSFTMATHGVDRTMQKHAAVPGDMRKNSVSSGTPSTVFYVKKADAKACTVCHQAHKNSADLNKEYAESGHGMATAGPWTRYDWKGSDRFYCQRCHTATGFKNLNDSLRSGTTYSALQNDYSYLYQGETSSLLGTLSGQNEALYCWACHTDNKGTIRNPGPVTIDYGYFTSGVKYSTVNYTFQDIGGSNVCVPCHAGRLVGDTIKSLPEAGGPAFSFSNASFINDHDFAGGGTVLTSAYEYAGREYTNSIIYKHDKIGTAGAPGTGSNGPCIGCHMSRTEKHLFLPVDTTTSHVDGTITAIATPVCDKCHGSGEALTMSPAMLEGQRALLEDADKQLTAVLELRGLFVRGSNAYAQRDGTILRAGNGLASGLVNVDKSARTATLVTSASLTNWYNFGIVPGISKLRVYSNNNVVPYTSATISTIDTDTQMTLVSYGGSTVTNAPFAIEKAETVLVTSGSVTVTGFSTLWTQTSVTGGDYFRVDSDGAWYKINSKPTADGTLTLSTVYSGATFSGAAYTIITATSNKNWLTGTDNDTTGSVTGKNNMGALYNYYHTANGDPAAFVHNRYYVKRILYDSIDWLDDNLMNYSAGATITALCPVTSTPSWCAGATEYLLPRGKTGGGDERP